MKKYLIFALLITVAALVINYSLGGFKGIEPDLITTNKVTVYGRPYEGRYNSARLDELLNELRTLLATSNNQGQLTIINYQRPELEKRGTVKQFVGIIWEAEPFDRNYDSLVLESYNAAQFTIPIRPLVMPSPEKLKGMAVEFATNMDTSLAGYSVEQYQDKTLVINYPLK